MRLSNPLVPLSLLLVIATLAFVHENFIRPAQEAARPNILLIMVDDLGNNDLGYSGDGAATTPNIDALAAGGVRFQRHYAHATCRPSRAALLTGMPASRVGVPPHFRGLSPELVTLPEALRDAGYATRHIGKWHLGDRLQSAGPDQHGFDHWYGFRNAVATRHGSLDKPGISYDDPWLEADDQPPQQVQGHMTDLFTARAVQEINTLAKGGQPWFINLWYFAPHGPSVPAERFGERYPKGGEGRYLALLEQLDEGIGQVLQALDASGQRDDTLVVFLSDNGGNNKYRDSNWPFQGKKHSFLEGGLRTPLVLFSPELTATDIQEPVFISDLMPTLLGFGKAKVPPRVEGRDLRPLLEGQPIPSASPYFWEMQLLDYVSFGMLDLERQRLHSDLVSQRWDPEQQQFLPFAFTSKSEVDAAAAAHRAWRREVRQVELIRRKRPDGRLLYAGDSYRRTPGYGAWTLQIPIDLEYPGPVTVEQARQLAIRVAEEQVEVTLPGYQFNVALEASGCQLLTLSSYYVWKVWDGEDARAHIALYLGDEQLRTATFPLTPDLQVDHFPPLLVSEGAGRPLILNDYFSGEADGELLDNYQQIRGAAPDCGEAG